MRQEEVRSICQAVASGGERLVRNLDLYYVGRVVACEGDRLKVEAFSHRFAWDADRCHEVSHATPRLGPPSSD